MEKGRIRLQVQVAKFITRAELLPIIQIAKEPLMASYKQAAKAVFAAKASNPYPAASGTALRKCSRMQ